MPLNVAIFVVNIHANFDDIVIPAHDRDDILYTQKLIIYHYHYIFRVILKMGYCLMTPLPFSLLYSLEFNTIRYVCMYRISYRIFC